MWRKRPHLIWFLTLFGLLGPPGGGAVVTAVTFAIGEGEELFPLFFFGSYFVGGALALMAGAIAWEFWDLRRGRFLLTALGAGGAVGGLGGLLLAMAAPGPLDVVGGLLSVLLFASCGALGALPPSLLLSPRNARA